MRTDAIFGKFKFNANKCLRELNTSNEIHCIFSTALIHFFYNSLYLFYCGRLFLTVITYEVCRNVFETVLLTIFVAQTIFTYRMLEKF